MYENKTVSEIQKELLDGISDIYEKSKGYFLWELTRGISIVIKNISNQITADSAMLNIYNLTGDDLENYTVKNEGISRKPAAYATGFLNVIGNGKITAGDAFETDGLIRFTANEDTTVNGSARILVTAAVAGMVGNVPASTVINMPVTISGITACINPEPMTGGYDAESDEELLARFLEYVRNPPTSGNKDHYKTWAKEVIGVSDAYVVPLWNGANTVKVVIINQEHLPASDELVAKVQNHIDPGITGMGDGEAPVGAFCTVASATAKIINISLTLIVADGYKLETVKTAIEDSIKEYFASLAFKQYYLSYAKIGAMVLDAEGVLDYSNLFINDGSSNITCTAEEVFVLGSVTASE